MNKSYNEKIGKKRGRGRKEKSNAGRKEKPLVWEEVDELLEGGCTGNEVAAIFSMHPDSFYKKVFQEKGIDYSEYAQERKCAGDGLIRSQQYSETMKYRI